jgi:glycosyltransferase involved in cell wall biosynthesis
VKILLAAFTYPPNVDGVASAALQMARNFRNAGHHVLVATGVSERRCLPEAGDGIEVKRFHITGSPALFEGFKGDTAAYQKLLIESAPDLIVCHCWNTWCSELLLPLIPRLSSRTILVSHGYSAHMLNPAILPRGIWKWMKWQPAVCALPSSLRSFDHVVFLSTKADLNRYFDAWVARVTRCRNTRIIPNGIDTSGWHGISPGFRSNHNLHDGVFFLCVANYFPGKNQMMALDAFTRADIPGSILVFIGSSLGDYGQRVADAWKERRERHPRIEVRFLEQLSREEVVSAIMSCDVAVLPSKTEAQPLTILESMACGKAFISTDVGCVSELKGGIIVHDIPAMTAAMTHLAATPAERQRLGAQGKRDFDKHYSTEVTNRKWITLLDEVTASLAR